MIGAKGSRLLREKQQLKIPREATIRSGNHSTSMSQFISFRKQPYLKRPEDTTTLQRKYNMLLISMISELMTYSYLFLDPKTTNLPSHMRKAD